MPIAAEDFPDAVDRLCTAARRSKKIELGFNGPQLEDDEGMPEVENWGETEPHITHLLVCAMAQLGGERPLAGVTGIYLWVSWSALSPSNRRALAHAKASRTVIR